MATSSVDRFPLSLPTSRNWPTIRAIFGYNALYTSDSSLRTFLNTKQYGGDWESSQTIAPTNLKVAAFTADSVTLSWNPILYSGDAGGYQILESGALVDTTADKSVSRHTVTGLTTGHSYSFSLRTVTAPNSYNDNEVISEETSAVDVTLSGSDLVELVSFTAKASRSAVTLKWETRAELNNAGFHLWRSTTRDGDYERITRAMIPAEGGATYEAAYTFRDHRVISGKTYHYRLEDIDTAGVSVYHGPVSITVGGISLTHPKHQGTVPAGSPATFRWVGDNAHRFKLQFSKRSDFKSGVVTLPSAVKKAADPWAGNACITDRSFTPNARQWKMIRDLGQKGEIIYWRVHGKNKAGKSVFSKATGLPDQSRAEGEMTAGWSCPSRDNARP